MIWIIQHSKFAELSAEFSLDHSVVHNKSAVTM
jgi:hypothetical protein